MSISAPSGPIADDDFPAVPRKSLWRLSVGQYQQMVRAGILTDDDPVELLDGYLVTKMGKNPLHATATDLAGETLARRLPPGWHVRIQDPITLPGSEPEPDLVVARGDRNRYLHKHPGPEDVALVVEVADTTLSRDQTVKKRIYAGAGVVVYWIVNLMEGLLEVYASPSGPRRRPDYHQRRDYGPESEVSLTIEGQEVAKIAVRDLLPPLRPAGDESSRVTP